MPGSSAGHRPQVGKHLVYAGHVAYLPGRCDAVVVGAGVAGLAAAFELSASGIDVVVLEAGDDVGGRVRTDMVEGYRLDRGFQVLNTAYPAVRRHLDLGSLRLRRFPTGLAVRTGRGLYPLRFSPAGIRGALGGEVLRRRDLLRLARLTAANALLPASRVKARPEAATEAAFLAEGISPETIDTVLRPFLSGIFLEAELATSRRFADLIWRSLARGGLSVPAAGMRAVPDQLASRLGSDQLRLRTPVERVEPGAVHTGDGSVRTRAVVVAADPSSAAELLPEVTCPVLHAVTTYYHVRNAAPEDPALLHVDGRPAPPGAAPIVNSVLLTATAPSYAPPGQALVATSVLGEDPVAEPELRDRLASLYGTCTRGWRALSTVAVPEALPAAYPPLGRLRRPVALGGGRYVAGDHRDTPSLQGALVSGSRTAAVVLRDLGGTPGPAAEE